jgi:hypothetical protein
MPTITQTGTATSPRQYRDVTGDHKVQMGQYAGPASYVSGGDGFAPSDLGMSTFDHVALGVAWNGTASRLLVYDKTNQKVIWVVPDTGAEATGDLSAYVADFLVLGH